MEGNKRVAKMEKRRKGFFIILYT